MAGRGAKIEKIIEVLRAVEVLVSQEHTVAEACRKTNVTQHTYYRWRKQYGGLQLNQVKRMKDLAQENTRLKNLVADLSLDNAILREANSGNF